MQGERQLAVARTIVLAVWIFGALSFFPPVDAMPVSGLGRALFGILFCVHLIEFPFFRRLYTEAGGSMFGHFLRHMVYGVLYKSEVEQRRRTAP